MTQERVTGFVVGSDRVPSGTVWKVRIDEGNAHPLRGTKFVVASVRDGIALAPGLNVDFIVGTQQWKGIPTTVAVDVRILTAKEDPSEATPKELIMKKKTDDVFTVYVVELEHRRSLALHPFWTVDQVTEENHDVNVGERVVAARSFTENELNGVFHIVRGLSVMDNEVEKLEMFLKHIFELGVEYQKKEGRS